MAATFSPEDIKIRGPEGLQFSDVWGLTCAQLGATVSRLLEVRPHARLTQDDLVGYHYLQYGIGEDTIEETIEALQGGISSWRDWDQATSLRESLSRVLGEQTMSALMHRIRLGDERRVSTLRLDPALPQFFDFVEEKDHANGDVTSLYPKNGSELLYKGRVSQRIGKVTIRNMAGPLRTSTDIMDLEVAGGFQSRTVVASSTNHGTSYLKAIRIL